MSLLQLLTWIWELEVCIAQVLGSMKLGRGFLEVSSFELLSKEMGDDCP